MQRKKIKLKKFFENTEAISPVVATILVLAVAVASGIMLFYWFGAFQSGAQAQVGNSTNTSMNIMVEKSLGSDVLKVTLPVSEFTHKSETIDADNDRKIFRPNSTGNYTKYKSTYVNTWFDERFIQEIPVYIENRGSNPLTNVKVKYVELPGALNFVLRLDRNNGWKLLKVDGGPAKVNYSTSGPVDEDKAGAYEYYFNGTKPAINYTDHSVNYTEQYSESFKNNNQTVITLFNADSKSSNAYAVSGTTAMGWNTGGTFFADASSDGLHDDNYEWSKQKLHDQTYIVGTLNPGEKKTVYTYFFTNYLLPKYCDSGSFKDCRISLPIQVITDQGMTQTENAILRIIDLDTT
ncbi:hypothetical protein ig2599ANME_0375 [groundwater metagenome]